MDTHEFDAHEGPFAADEFADDAEGFGTIDELDLPARAIPLHDRVEVAAGGADDVA